MKQGGLRIVILGLSITSSWGNGHATTYRGLARELVRRGHDLLFLERDQPWYAQNRDLARPAFGRTELYSGLDELQDRFTPPVRDADLVIVGSFVPEGACVGDWVQRQAGGITAFYDIDTPVTLARLDRGEHDYLRPAQIAGYDLYLSFTGGPTLRRLESRYGSPRARVLYCSVDPELYFPEPEPLSWDLGYMGTYSIDRQPVLERLLLEAARQHPDGRFVVAGPQYPATIAWPGNVEYEPHVAPAEHRAFYNRQRFTLNVTRSDMIEAGWSPSVRLFEAAACGTPIISDRWRGLDSLLAPGVEILLADTVDEVLAALRKFGEDERIEMGQRARRRILAEHTAAHRAEQLERYALELLGVVAAWHRPWPAKPAETPGIAEPDAEPAR
jgi:spore maturation protein CgeB